VNRSIIPFFAGAIAAGLGVFFIMFMLLGSAREDLQEQRAELDAVRAQAVDARNDAAQLQLELHKAPTEADLLAAYCRGVIDEFLAPFPFPSPDAQTSSRVKNDAVCLDAYKAGEFPPELYRGP
jgi:hypothetical protein